MSNETLFFICGIALAVSAVAVSLVGLKVKDFPGRAFPLVVLWFVILVGGATTFAVLPRQGRGKGQGRRVPAGGEEVRRREQRRSRFRWRRGEGREGGGAKPAPETAAKGPGGTLKLAADPTEIAYDQTSLSSKPGKVTIDFTNPATLEHDVAIEGPEGKELATSALIGKGKTSVSANLAPGTYHSFCTVPGHREAGMEGTLTVK